MADSQSKKGSEAAFNSKSEPTSSLATRQSEEGIDQVPQEISSSSV